MDDVALLSQFNCAYRFISLEHVRKQIAEFPESNPNFKSVSNDPDDDLIRLSEKLEITRKQYGEIKEEMKQRAAL